MHILSPTPMYLHALLYHLLQVCTSYALGDDYFKTARVRALRHFPILRVVIVHIEAVPERHFHTTESSRIKIDVMLSERERGKVHHESVNMLITAIYNEYYPMIETGFNMNRTAIEQIRSKAFLKHIYSRHNVSFLN